MHSLTAPLMLAGLVLLMACGSAGPTGTRAGDRRYVASQVDGHPVPYGGITSATLTLHQGGALALHWDTGVFNGTVTGTWTQDSTLLILSFPDIDLGTVSDTGTVAGALVTIPIRYGGPWTYTPSTPTVVVFTAE